VGGLQPSEQAILGDIFAPEKRGMAPVAFIMQKPSEHGALPLMHLD